MRHLLLTCLLLSLPLPAQSEADGPDYFAVIGVASDDVLNIRAEPDAGSSKIGEIPPDGTGVRNLGCEGGLSFAEWEQATPADREVASHGRWCRISWQAVEGWVAGQFLTEGTPADGG